MSLKNLILPLLTLSLISTFSSGCSTAPHAPEEASIEPTEKTQAAQAQDQITKLQEKIQDLETRISALNDKINLENGAKADSIKNDFPTQSAPTTVVQTPSAQSKIVPTTKPSAKKTAGKSTEEFTQNEAIDRYREAKILFDSKRYGDAILEFSEFVKNEPDHPLAPAAQYHMGMSYLLQKEYKLAEEELNRGLIAYPHSNYVPDTLLALVQVSENLQKAPRVTYYKQKLLSNFPNSPQAKGITLASATIAPTPKTVTHSESIETPEAPIPPTAPESTTEGAAQ